MYFHEYFVNFDGDFGAFDERGSYNFVPNKRPPFSLFSKRPGRLKVRIRYVYSTKAVHQMYFMFVTLPQLRKSSFMIIMLKPFCGILQSLSRHSPFAPFGFVVTG